MMVANATEASSDTRVAVLAGKGKMPSLVAKELSETYPRVIGCFLNVQPSGGVMDYLDKSKSFHPKNFETILNYLQNNNIDKLIMCGKVERTMLFEEGIMGNLDNTANSSIRNMKTKNDQNIIREAANLLEDQGIEILGLKKVMGDSFTPVGHWGGPAPSSGSLQTLDQLAPVAVSLADQDVGQSVTGKRQSVVAVEAAEGTNDLIRRSGSLAGDNCVFLKVARSNQDYRFDVPVVGEKTIRTLVEINADLAAAEANRTLWVQRRKCIDLAKKSSLTLFGWSRSGE